MGAAGPPGVLLPHSHPLLTQGLANSMCKPAELKAQEHQPESGLLFLCACWPQWGAVLELAAWGWWVGEALTR